MNIRIASKAIILLFASGMAAAQTYNSPPQDGYWWNPVESGRGYTFETQNDVVVITHYAYDTSGRSVFFQNASQWNAASRSVSTNLLGFSGGQCVGCPYVAPSIANLGTITFSFTSSTRGQARYPNGVVVPIERFNFVYSDPRNYLKGIWASVWVGVSSGEIFANYIYFNADCITCTVPNSVQGRLAFSNSGRPVVGAPSSASPGVYLVVIDATTSFFDYYFVVPDSDSWSGIACTRLKTDPAPTLTNCLGFMDASRASSYAEALVVIGPASTDVKADANVEPSGGRERAASNLSVSSRGVDVARFKLMEALGTGADAVELEMAGLRAELLRPQ